jgi:transcriptional regulator GlxA family with amidase domain
MNLLRTTSDSIQNIAARSGFSSIAAFNRNFRQQAGTSPSQWRSGKNHL